MNKNELLKKMEEAMDRYDLSKEIEKAHIGEWMYGVSMVPCNWVYKYVTQPEIVRCKDCKWYKEGYNIDGKWFSRCNGSVRTYGHTKPDWFCADGERRDGDV